MVDARSSAPRLPTEATSRSSEPTRPRKCAGGVATEWWGDTAGRWRRAFKIGKRKNSKNE